MPPPRPRLRTYVEIADDIEQRIHKQEFVPGSQLPSNTELAFFYKVGLTSIAKAVGLLHDRGVIYSLPGRGKFVAGDDESNEENA